MLQVVPVISDQLPVISYQESGVSESGDRSQEIGVSESGVRR
ncbi:MAG: hypothetical protein PX481_08670 [Microcystis sp. M53603_WE2]|nr:MULTISPECIES: hypothetical protein [unclassified Microcystis]MCZ8364728.1 hypothetical protein [Microcystis sp. LE19-251.1A]MDJ0528362.1 hypothetical protein [Microcystis sp. M53600_WE12]MDJ0564587.1 hypothetical protein [Microcystis sp. M49629_WE12]MCZ8026279.1 hypothetical protein [Microcystis sp. LE19-10.1B]MDJ0538756.1 hypothetical protein [Microcystis sp. M53603_WE2]